MWVGSGFEPGECTSQVYVISAGQMTVSVFQLSILVPVTQLTIHARIAALILLVLLHSALALVLIRSMLDYVADDLSEFFMCHPGLPLAHKNRGRQQEGRPQVRGLVFVHMHAYLNYAELLLPYGQKRSLFPYGMADHATGFATVPSTKCWRLCSRRCRRTA